MLTLKPLASIMNHPVCYRLWQRPFVESKFAPILRHNQLSAVRRVLDVGCGPGTNADYFDAHDYLGIDHSARYIEMAQARGQGRFLVADACSFVAPAEERFDFILLNSLLHHIDAAGVRRMLTQLHDQLSTDGHVHILDLVLPQQPSVARFLAHSDRGDFPRSWEQWQELFCEAFQQVICEPCPVSCCGVTLWNMVYFKGSRKT